MAYTSYHEAQALPRIIASGPDHYRGHHHHHHPRDMHMSSSPAMIIPGSESHTDVPPPLPPPQFPFGHAPHSTHSHHPHHHHFGSSHHSRDMHREPRFGYTPSSASNYGSLADEPANYKRRDFDHHDEGYASVSTDRSRDSLHTGFGLHHNKFHFHSPADVHVDSLKQKLNPIRTHDKSPPRSLLSSSERPIRTSHDARALPQLSMPVQLPFHSRSMVDSPARSGDTPVYSAVSPVSAPFPHGASDFHSYSDASDLDRSPRQRRRNNSDDATSTQGSFDYNGAEDMEIDDTSSLKRLRIEDSYSSTGLKRRAPSPADEVMTHGLTNQGDLVRRREGASRGSPTPRLTTVPQGSSISSMSSVSRSNSYMSTASMAPSSITTANSYGRRSPGGLSPGGISPTSCNSPYNAPMSLNPSPRTSISGRAAVHSRTVSGASPRKLAEMPKPGGSKLQKFFMCECCPKKPKKFETAEELSTHEAEKQYECSYCGNRFKNKNEAERHQNSLHVRRHSWSCSALLGYSRAFHDSTNRPGEADTCGYCGEDFPLTGLGPGSSALGGTSSTAMAHRHATDHDWEERIRHLQEVHKFRECNSSKKFYRADHFRQHLKHSHAGTSGKWTNMLENACMLEEDPTPR